MTGRREEAGFTLIELVVAAAVILIAGSALLTFMEGTSNVAARVEKNVVVEEDLQSALRTITSDLRSASTLSACTGIDYRTCVTIDIPRQSGTSACPARRLRYWLASRTVWAARTDYSSTCATSTVVYTSRPIMTNVTSTGAIFRYYTRNGSVIDPLTAAATVPSTASVTVELKASQGMKGAPDVTLSAPAALRNNR